MKKLLSILVIIVLIITFFSAMTIKSIAEDEAIPFVQFSSFEDFLNAYLAIKEGGSVIDFMERGLLPDSINFTEFEILHLPAVISENFVIRRIYINEYGMTIWFLPKYIEGPTSAFWQRWNQYPYFQLDITYKSPFEISMEALLQSHNQTVHDLINGKYFVSSTPNLFISFIWFSDDLRLRLYVNLRQQDTEEFKTLIGSGNPREFVRFSETRTVDLTDTAAVLDLINFGERFLRGDVNGDMRVDTADALEILRYAVGLTDEIDYDAADMNRDGKVDTADALAVLRMAVGLAE